MSPKKPPLQPFKKGEAFQLDLAIWNWAGFLIKNARAGKQKQYIESMTKLHGKDIVDQIITLARERWKAGHKGDE